MRKFLSHARQLNSIGPANNDRLSAVRVALSVAVPTLILLGIGHPELTLYAVFGGLTAMYGRNESHQLRLKHQLQAAVVLLGGVSVGTFLAVNQIHSWSLVAVEAVLAGVGSLYSDRVRLKPNGPFFGILALGACASVPVNVPFGVAVLIAAASAAFSLLVGFAGWLRVRAWESGATRQAPRPTPARRQAAVVHAARYATAVGVAGSIGVLSGSSYPHWAMAAAAVPLAGADMPSAVYRGIHRIVGTFLGLGIVAVVLFPGPASPLQYFPAPVVLVLLVIACQFCTELFMTRHYGWAMVFFTPVILLITELAAATDPGRLIAERAAETLIGALTGIAVVVLIRARKAPVAAVGAGLP